MSDTEKSGGAARGKATSTRSAEERAAHLSLKRLMCPCGEADCPRWFKVVDALQAARAEAIEEAARLAGVVEEGFLKDMAWHNARRDFAAEKYDSLCMSTARAIAVRIRELASKASDPEGVPQSPSEK